MKTIIIVDSSNPIPYKRAMKGIFRMLDHFGIYYEILDISWVRISPEELKDVHLLIIAQEGWETPDTYADIFSVLGAHGVLPPSEVENFRKMVAFRNVIVHNYMDINWNIVKSVFDELDIFREFSRYIARFIADSDDLSESAS